MQRKLIRLTGIGDELTEKAKAKAKVKFLESEGEEDYELDDDDYQKVEQEILIFVDEIVSFVRAEEEKETVLFTKNGLNFTVKETLDEIENKLNNY